MHCISFSMDDISSWFECKSNQFLFRFVVVFVYLLFESATNDSLKCCACMHVFMRHAWISVYIEWSTKDNNKYADSYPAASIQKLNAFQMHVCAIVFDQCRAIGRQTWMGATAGRSNQRHPKQKRFALCLHNVVPHNALLRLSFSSDH